MTNRQQIQAIPGALRMTLEKVRAEYGGVIRKVRWGEGPLFVCGAGQYAPLGLAAGYAFEAFPEWPVVAHSAETWRHYGLSLLHPRSVLAMISPAGEWPEAQELARSARSQGCTIVALTHAPDTPLAKLADHLFLIHADGEPESPAVGVSTFAALNELAFEAMRVLKKPKPWWEQMEQELEQLPKSSMDFHAASVRGALDGGGGGAFAATDHRGRGLLVLSRGPRSATVARPDEGSSGGTGSCGVHER